ncbi:SRPBCC family protein [Hathewaya histolytica]|uniref:Activator of Hsp90 ATPase homolog 1-like protein n=1 Tax=Hathewaya histolytica TaxID=1498 RepID=A0A4U9RNL7_HATHI|nr:SRPBCC family protein [Hathewaya histolytica]VTQ93844.1 Activator of Hsp90 ATPase homolog 1-like protein [Hathewaya histolytica]
MKPNANSNITVETTIDEPIERVWKYWTEPQHITKWNNASDDWHTSFAENDLRVGGKFISRMEAKDASFGFDFGGTYTEVKLYEIIEYIMDDGRKVEINFINQENKTKIIENFEAEKSNPIELQRKGWQAILDNFKKYAEQAEV